MGKGMQKFLFVGNHPCLDLVNTQLMVKGEPRDLLEGFDDLVLWLIQARLLTASQAGVAKAKLRDEEAASLLDQAKTLRATFRAASERIAVGRAVPDSAVTTINQFLAQRPGYPELIRTTGGFKQRFHSLASQQAELLAPIVEAASNLLSSGQVVLVKKCANPACILYFFDTTKNHARTWCSMRICGNRMKVAAHYRRKRSREA